ncbi:adenomatous polyposis coli protein-like isoform X2 [Cylas formicarius]|uniref:adenomatous polyposis coli protein-like isoform X2 n=1 Tax=Cylas formicarius TaxID=197179 RepID=UPI0029584A80|nr:adenomatous polyposis coli protein-like isoform X2 [Cylas formicarius]
MSLPVSQYEALLAEVRGLRRKAQRVQQLARPLIGEDKYPGHSGPSSSRHPQRGPANLRHQNDASLTEPLDYTMDSLLLNRQRDRSASPGYAPSGSSCPEPLSSEDECFPRSSGLGVRSSTQMSVSSEPAARGSREANADAVYRGAWPAIERPPTLWNSEPASLGGAVASAAAAARQSHPVATDASSVMSFASSSGGVPLDRVLGSPPSKWSSQQLEAKMDVVHGLLAMLGSQEHVDMGETLLALSACPESCLAMRQSGCIPLLVQLVQSDKDEDTRKKAAQALHNLVNSQPDEKIRKRESRILKLLEHARAYVEALNANVKFESCSWSASSSDDGDRHPVQTVAHLMKLSFDEGHRQAICQLGGIHSIATLIEAEHAAHGSVSVEHHCVLMRRYACMALTNLTFGDSGNKALLCSFRDFMRALVVQLMSPSDELRQVTASVLRNLSWRADATSKEILREVGSVSGLMKAAMLDNKENTLKSILSALWNLSAHCTENKSEICAVDGALGFLVTMLTYKTPSKSLAVVENAGGILRNVSSQIAVRDDHRETLRAHGCLRVLLDQLKSPSLTIVSNACGTLWNLSAKCSQDQEALWEMGAPAMLRSLNHSKHKMIAMGSSAALKNLLTCRPQQTIPTRADSTALALNLPELPTLGARKQKALLQDLDHTLSETYDNLDKESPVAVAPRVHRAYAKTSRGSPLFAPMCAVPPRRDDDDDDDDAGNDQPIDYSRKENNDMAYAETDLDQPTDYSLRYAEDDSDSDLCCAKIAKQEYVQDTVKTYCTEGTPYETPYVVSNATSMSDLRTVGEKPRPAIDNDDVDKDNGPKVKEGGRGGVDEKDRCSTEDISEMHGSGLMSPDKPVNYCEEGTPGYFSRVSSFGSLNSIPVKKEEEEEEEEEPSKKVAKAPESKAVKFDAAVGYAEETPLMFSRSSSLASLDSIEQHSIHDDRSSVVSDFSRLTSGVVSPSELPDSPTQMVPPSPKASTSKPSRRIQRSDKTSVFEDRTTGFKEESMPAQFSTATSLSSLTIDDHREVETKTLEAAPEVKVDDVADDGKGQEKKDEEKETSGSDSADDEDILAACINDGIQTSVQNPTACSTPSKQSSDIPTLRGGTSRMTAAEESPRTYCTEDTPAHASRTGSNSNLSALSADVKGGGNVSDDSSNLSGDNDNNILAECILSAMPKSRKDTREGPASLPPQHVPATANNGPTGRTPMQPIRLMNVVAPRKTETPKVQRRSRDNSLPPYLIGGGTDEVENYAVENSPCQFSLRSSLSDLTVDESVAGVKTSAPTGSRQADESSGVGNENRIVALQSADQKVEDKHNVSRESNPNPLDRKESLSSLSLDSMGSIEGEQALLEQCIYSGMPTDKAEEALLKEVISAGMPNSGVDKPTETVPKPQPRERRPNERPSSSSMESRSKNGNVASVAGNIKSVEEGEATRLPPPPTNEPCPEPSIAAAGVENGPERDSSGTENCWFSDRAAETEPVMREAVEGSASRRGGGASSVTGTSPDRLSPSGGICLTDRTRSGSKEDALLVASCVDGRFAKSCEESGNLVDVRMLDPDAMIESLDRFTAELVSQASHLTKDKTSTNESSSTWNDDSTSPTNEATFPSISGSAPNVVTFESDKDDAPEERPSNDFSTTSTMTESTLIAMEATRIATVFKREAEMSQSAASLELDMVRPPSQLNSLTTMAPPSPKLGTTRKPLSSDVLVKRALNHRADSFDGVTEEVDEKPNPIFDVKQKYMVDLESTNPPSIFSEITDMCDSLADVATETIGADSDIYEDCGWAESSARDDDFSDANSATPHGSPVIRLASIQTDASSAESTPERSQSASTKRRRSVARDRYKTYTVSAAEVVSSEVGGVEPEEASPSSVGSPKLTPKERRKLDPARTRTLSESNFSPDTASSDLHFFIRTEADLVVKTLRDAARDDLLECETLSLVSNDEDSEHNSGGSTACRTYHKSWDPPVSTPEAEGVEQRESAPAKPKIVKPELEERREEPEEAPKTVRGRRKPLYSPRTVTKAPASSSSRSAPKPPAKSSPKHVLAPLERQGTFTKDETPPQAARGAGQQRSKIPAFASKIARAVTTRIPAAVTTTPSPPSVLRNGGAKSASTDRTNVNRNWRMYNRSTSADSRERPATSGRIQASSSTQSLRNESKYQNGNAKKSCIPSPTQRSASSASLATPTTSTKKQVTSKIASLWKRVEESKTKQQQVAKDTRVWIQNGAPPKLVRGDTFENKEGVVLRKKASGDVGDETKRVSRLGSFIVVNEDGEGVSTTPNGCTVNAV